MDKFSLLKLKRSIIIALIEQNKIFEAIDYFEKYCKLINEFDIDKNLINNEIENSKHMLISKLLEIANKSISEKNYANAIIAYESILNYDILNIECIKEYITCLNTTKQYDLAIILLDYLDKINKDIDNYKFISQAYENQNKYKESALYADKYINLKSDLATADDYNFHGCIYNKYYSEKSHLLSDIEKSMNSFIKASDISPRVRLYAKNVTIMAGKGNFNEICRKYWDRLLNINLMTNDDKYDYAAFCLKTKNFSDWHKYFGARFAKENNATFFPKINKPQWTGKEDLSDLTLLVYCEQGFGDTFLMWGYFSRLINLAKKIIFVVQDEIYDLLKNNDLGIEIYSRDYVNLNKLEYDYYIPSMSIPSALNLDINNISVGKGYIKPNQSLVDEYKKQFFNTNKFKIGISVSGNLTGNKTRDINIKELLILDEMENIEIYNLTKGMNKELFDIFKRNKVINIIDTCKNFADTAAVMANLDTILTADNCILNLAGAMGIKTFAIFNYTNEFRWFNLTGENVTWYTSVKPYVCDDINNWKSAIVPAVEDIKTTFHL